MAADELFCKFHQYGHCKFGPHCKKFHTQQTCSNVQCKVIGCSARHPKQCKFFLMFGRCKFGESCSYLHVSARDIVDKAISDEIKTLKMDIETLKTKNSEIEALIIKVDEFEQHIESLRKESVIKDTLLAKHKCDECDYEAKTLTVLKRHKTMKHKQKSDGFNSDHPASSTSSASAEGSIHSTTPENTSTTTDFNLQPPVPCLRVIEGCQNTVTKYSTQNMAICTSCKLHFDEMMKSSPFPDTLCPCCHEPSHGPSYSFCSDCLGSLEQDGFMDSGWGYWILERSSGDIICTNLDF